MKLLFILLTCLLPSQLLREGKIDNEHHKLQNMLMDLQEGNKKLKDLNRGQLQVIRNMAEGNSSVKFKAQSITTKFLNHIGIAFT